MVDLQKNLLYFFLFCLFIGVCGLAYLTHTTVIPNTKQIVEIVKEK